MRGHDLATVMTCYNGLWRPGGTARAADVIHPDFVRHGSSGELRGVDAFVRYVEHYRAAFPDLAFAVADWLAARDRLTVRYSFTGTHRRPFMGLPASGRPVTADGVAIYRVAEGRLVEIWDYLDLYGLERRLAAPPHSINPALAAQ
ncbi:ester cyclase [Nocardiopsis sp. JB363]|uniref:ester cyclase n=1 Tax=Nocardiopsis sp. JB363 TaxID=1434837 RepID=UPI000979D372|nr:ester cyclase [Nocardiopsis sp. JB363]SIO84435.1 hypothetical protein BQ8420_01885 [Nocardiopsis sp. JB363]